MYQSITILGNLGGTPEMKYLGDGTAVTNFSMATTESWGSGNDRKTETTWWRVAVFGRQAESVNQYLYKGSKVLVTGRMSIDKETGGPRIWSRTDGTPGANFELRANSVKFLNSKAEGEALAAADTSGGGGNSRVEEDDIPF